MKPMIHVKKKEGMPYQITFSMENVNCCFWSKEKPNIEYTEEKTVTA